MSCNYKSLRLVPHLNLMKIMALIIFSYELTIVRKYEDGFVIYFFMKEKVFDILNQYYYLQYIFSKSDS